MANTENPLTSTSIRAIQSDNFTVIEVALLRQLYQKLEADSIGRVLVAEGLATAMTAAQTCIP